ncbi:pyruvate carboxylase [Bryobacterales bacterium F-183]|nr:pyruvate carboxylase [Bryobacterales bacterium F-183]
MQKLLALNRGEIAIRILRAANELGLRTVAVYSQEDRLSLHRFKADEAYLIGEGKGPVQAYLDVDNIVAMAAEKKVDYIHPGYGFLSENPALARACKRHGITFVGPSAELLELLGDKTAARALADKAGIRTVPGTKDPVTDISGIEELGAKIGYPLIVKAAFGGGGRGMRVVNNASELVAKVDEARREAAAAFGNDAVFLERYIRRARHVEVQIIGDTHGNILHLYERDCSVQRRHQKVVETAPAVNLDPRIRRELAEAAVALAKAGSYYNAGTVEFLVDVDAGEWFFIEVNPRVQVEHTVTEMITGIDIVQTQIQVAQGKSFDEIGLPAQADIPIHGFALQSRVTTEDPANGFVPDYGKIHTYRSPAGFGIRLDGASAYGGAVITPYYDSLLVKVTAWGRKFPDACHRMDRALREFRIRGIKTNIPFLENVVNHPKFQAGEITTSFLDEDTSLFKFKARRDRATKLLTYLSETIINGNPEVKGKPKPTKALRTPAPLPHSLEAPLKGTRDLLLEIGPEKFAQWTREQTRLLLTDTTMRDAHQSLMATRMRTYDMLQTANYVSHHMSGLYSLEMWGGATFDVALRFLLEDPWSRLAKLREAIPNICFQMLLRASNAVGYTAYPDNVVDEFIQESSKQGIDIFRVFDSLNWLPNMKLPMEAVRKTNRSICEAAVCYSGDILDPKRDKYTLQYYVKMAKELEKMGAHVLAIKDMAGLAKPYAIHKLVKTLREEVGLPIHFHTHDTSGINASSIFKASEAGVDVADAALASMSGTTSQPNLNSIVASLANTDRDTGLNLEALDRASDYWETVRTYYVPFDSAPKSGTAEVYLHEMPGGQYTNLKEQAEAMGLGPRWHEVAVAYAEANQALGDIIKVTPSSKVVGDLAIFLVNNGMKAADLAKLGPNHNLTLPNSVVEMLSGDLGEPEGGWPEDIVATVLKGAKPRPGRPGEHLKPVDLEEAHATLEQKTGRKCSHTDLMSYLMYPDVFLKYNRAHATYGDVEVLPTPEFFYGLEKAKEIVIELEAGKTLVTKLLTISDPHPDGSRVVFFELNGQPREVKIRDKSLQATVQARAKADPSKSGEVGAPIPGAISSIAVENGATVKKGDRLLVMEAMKMQSTIYAPIDGKVKQLLVAAGQNVEAKDLLIVIE